MADNKEVKTDQPPVEIEGATPNESPEAADLASINEMREALKSPDWVAKMFVKEPADKKPDDKAEKNEGDPAKADATAQKGEKADDKSTAASSDKAATTQKDGQPAEPAAKPKRRKDPPPQPKVDLSAVADAAASAAAATVAKLQPQAQPKADELPPHIARHEAVYRKLEESNPTKYKDIVRRLADFSTKEEQRAARWEADHPGESYDPDAPEHKQWYASNEVTVDPEDFTEAKIDLRVDEKLRSRVDPKVEEVSRRLEQEQIRPVEQEAAVAVTSTIFRSFVPEGEITRDSVDQWSKKDPVAYEVAGQVDQKYRPIAQVVPRLYRGIERFDQNNVNHVEAKRLLGDMESELSELDPSEMVKDGKRWVTINQFYQLSPADRARAWCVSEADVTRYVSLRAGEEAKRAYGSRVAEFEKAAAALGYVRNGASNTTHEPRKQDPAPQPVSKSPSVGSAPASDGKTPGSSDQTKTALDPLWQRIGI